MLKVYIKEKVAFSSSFVTVAYWFQSWEVTLGRIYLCIFVCDFLADDGVALFLCFATSGCLVF